MGSLCGVSKSEDESMKPRIRTTQPQNSETNVVRNNQSINTNVNINNKKSKSPEKKPTIANPFKDLDEHQNGKMIGEGIKKIPSYKCLLTYDQLEKLREEFWCKL